MSGAIDAKDAVVAVVVGEAALHIALPNFESCDVDSCGGGRENWSAFAVFDAAMPESYAGSVTWRFHVHVLAAPGAIPFRTDRSLWANACPQSLPHSQFLPPPSLQPAGTLPVPSNVVDAFDRMR